MVNNLIYLGLILAFLIVIGMWFMIAKTSRRAEYRKSNQSIQQQKIKNENLEDVSNFLKDIGYKVTEVNYSDDKR